MTACEAALPLPGVRSAWVLFCGEPGVRRDRYTCPHGHVRDRVACAGHAPQPGEVGCRACWDDGHECPMTAELLEEIR